MANDSNSSTTVPVRKYQRVARKLELLEQKLEDRSRELYRLTQSLEHSNEYLRTILSEIPDALFVISDEGRVHTANRAACELLRTDEETLTGRPVGEFLQMKGSAVSSGSLPKLVGREIELEFRSADGGLQEMLCSTGEMQVPGRGDDAANDSATPQRCYCLLARDVSERRHAMEKIRNLARLVEENPSIVMRIGADKRLLYVNPAGRAFAQAQDCRLGKAVPEHLAMIVDDVVESGHKYEQEEAALGRTWNLLYAPVRGQPYVNVYGVDITERIEVERQLLNNAFYDELTGLPNRALLRDHVDLALRMLQGDPDRRFALLEIDLDRFRYINENYGHRVGDLLLQRCAERLLNCFRARDTVARFSADAFCVLQDPAEDLSTILRTVERLNESFRTPFLIGDHELFISVCVGITVSTPDYEDPDDILRDTDTALYRAKSSGRGNYAVFDMSMQERMRRFLSLEARLRKAIESGSFLLHYQPKVAADSGRLCGFEALLRWPDEGGGMISPAEFVPVAEDTGLILPLGDWVNNAVCGQIKAWSEQAGDLVPVAVNISGKQFEQDDFLQKFGAAIEAAQIRGELVHAEITESSLMGEVWPVVKRLRKLKQMGVVSAIDDFGTGYSSLAYLKQFPVGYLKVDRAFIKDMHQNPDDLAITSAIIAMAHQLGLQVIAEGVENERQVEILNELGCEQVQGYFFSKPVDADTALEILRRGHC